MLSVISKRLFWRRAETAEGAQTVREAYKLSRMVEYAHLSEGELLRLAYWGASGEKP